MTRQPYNHFEIMAYFEKTGHMPKKREKHDGNWNLVYGETILAYNKPYAVCVNEKKSFGRQFGYKKDRLKIVPCK